MTTNLHLDGALNWYDKGFCVVPAVADGTKKPFARWKEFQTKRPTRAQVERWYKTTPAQGVGLVCGKVSDNLEMLELEGRATSGWHLDRIAQQCHDAGISYLWDMLNENGYCESTPSGGLHFLYRISDHDVPGNEKVANRPPTDEELAEAPHVRALTLAETRGEGGFVIVAPTGGTVHKSGDSWSCLAGRIGEVPVVRWSEREALVGAIRAALDVEIPKPEIPQRPVGIPVDNGDGPGADFNRRETWETLLPAYGWTFSHTYGGEHFWVRPGKDLRDGHSASLYYQGSDNLYVWSSSTPLPTEEPISKFAFVAFMDFAGDFSRCASDLRRQGFGGALPQSTTSWIDEIPMAAQATTSGGTVTVTLEGQEVQAPRKAGFQIEEYTETGVAHVMVNLFGDQFRSVHEERGWRVYEDGVWIESKKAEVDGAVEDVTGRLRRHCQRLVDAAANGLANAQASQDREMIAEAKEELKAAESLAKFASTCRSDRGHKAVKNRFGAQPKIATSVDQFDRDKSMIATETGVIDLQELSATPVSDLLAHPHSPELMLTRKVGIKFDPDAQAPRWRRYLEEVLPDAGYRDYLKRAVGMALLGDTSESAFFVLHGQTGCGKSVFFEVMEKVFGDFAATAAPNTFRDTRDDGSRRANDLHELRGARFVATSETSERTSLNEELVKRVTGGDRVTSHGLFQANVSWKPQFTMFMATNFKPRLNSGDGAIWRRVKPIEFPNTFYNSDGSAKESREGNLGQWLVDNELAGIFNWLLEGVRAYLIEGLGEPEQLRKAVAEYREESDPVIQFLAEAVSDGTLIKDPAAEMTVTQMYSVYVTWVKSNNGYPVGKTKFGNRMNELGYVTEQKSGGIRVRRGFVLNPNTWIGQAQGGGFRGTDTWPKVSYQPSPWS